MSILPKLSSIYQATSSPHLDYFRVSQPRAPHIIIRELFLEATPLEVKWLTRIIFRNLELPFSGTLFLLGFHEQMRRLSVM